MRKEPEHGYVVKLLLGWFVQRQKSQKIRVRRQPRKRVGNTDFHVYVGYASPSYLYVSRGVACIWFVWRKHGALRQRKVAQGRGKRGPADGLTVIVRRLRKQDVIKRARKEVDPLCVERAYIYWCRRSLGEESGLGRATLRHLLAGNHPAIKSGSHNWYINQGVAALPFTIDSPTPTGNYIWIIAMVSGREDTTTWCSFEI